MRRGLMGWNAEELPVATLEARLARLRAGMAKAGMDAFVIYTNNTRPSAVAYVTGFTPYWSDALMLVRQDRRAGVRHRAVEARVGVDQDHRSAERDRQHAEARHADGRAAGEGAAVKTRRRAGIRHAAVGAGRRHGRRRADGRMDRRHGAVRRPAPRGRRSPSADCWRAPTRWRSRRCARRKPARRKTPARSRASVEQNARLAGAEETYIAVAPDLAADRRLNRTSQPTPLADRFAVRASIAYKGCWVRRTRTFAKDTAKADAWFDGVVRSLEAGQADRRAACGEGEGAARRDADEAGWPRAAPAAIRCRRSRPRARRQRTRR